MEKELWERVLANWEQSYYAEALWFCCSIITIIISIIYYRKKKTGRFILYSIWSLILIFSPPFLLSIMSKKEEIAIVELLNATFLFIELFAFYGYFMPTLYSKKIKFFLNKGLIIFSLLSVWFTIGIFFLDFSSLQILTFGFRLNVLEMLLLLVLCLTYFSELMLRNPADAIPLIQLPSIWLASGLLMYILFSLPFFVIANILTSFNHSLFYIMSTTHYISISILLICISKTLTCKTLQPV